MTPKDLAHVGAEALGIVKHLVLSHLGGPPTRGVMTLVENDEGHILLVKARYRSRWGLPGGWVDARETFVEAAAREVAEETGVVLHEQPTFVHEFIGRRHIDQLFRGHASGATIAVTTPWEIEAMRWSTMEDLPVLAKAAQRILESAGLVPTTLL